MRHAAAETMSIQPERTGPRDRGNVPISSVREVAKTPAALHDAARRAPASVGTPRAIDLGR